MELNVGIKFSQEQEMLRSSARAFLGKEAPLTFVRSLEQSPGHFPAELWKKVAEVGWPSLPVPAQYGGSDGGFLDVAVLLDELGRALFPGPFLWSSLSALLLGQFGAEEQKKKYLPAIADGVAVFTIAWPEKSGDYALEPMETAATRKGEGLILSGRKYFVPCGSYATHYLVAAKTPEKKLAVAIVPREQPSVAARALATTGWDNQAIVDFKDTPLGNADLLPADGAAVLQRALHLGVAMQCLYMSGMAQRALEITRDYAKVRVQFGRPIGSFQAVQHHLANMAADTDISRNVSYRLAERIAVDGDIAFDAPAAKAWCAPACMRVMQTGHQVHGGIGVITDHAMQMYFLRMKPLEMLLGDADFHTRLVAGRLKGLVA